MYKSSIVSSYTVHVWQVKFYYLSVILNELYSLICLMIIANNLSYAQFYHLSMPYFLLLFFVTFFVVVLWPTLPLLFVAVGRPFFTPKTHAWKLHISYRKKDFFMIIMRVSHAHEEAEYFFCFFVILDIILNCLWTVNTTVIVGAFIMIYMNIKCDEFSM